MGPDPSLTPDLIQSQSFTSGFRGYDPAEVRAFLNRIAIEVRALHERAEELESAWRSAEERAARPPVLDEDTLMAAVGEETASILRSARAAAADLRAKASEEAGKVLVDAREEAAKTREEMDALVASETQAAKDEAAGIVAGARTEAGDLLERARVEADAIRAEADRDRDLTIEGANSTRDRILEDLARRRRVATVQIEQLRAGRERLIESYAVVRRTLEEAQSELSRADAEARAAADEVGRRLRSEPDVEASEAASSPEEDPARADGIDGPPGEDPPADGGAPPDAKSAGPSDGGSGDDAPASPPVIDVTDTSEKGAPPALKTRPRRRGPLGRGRGPEATPAPQSENGTVGLDEGPAEAAAGPGAVITEKLNEPDPEAPPGSAVDQLFARIRATQAAEPTPEGAAPAEPADAVAVADEPDHAGAAEGVTSQVPDGDESLLQQRESAVVDLEVTLTRRLKRALQDEQNDLLDKLRSLRGEPTAERLLPPAEQQRDRYAQALRPLLVQAAEAGAAFAGKALGREGGTNNGSAVRPDEPALDQLAAEAGENVAGALRRRLEHAIGASAGDDQAVLIEAVGAAYREWKTQRIERLAGDMLSAAYARGTWQAAPEGTLMRWIVEDTDGPCPDCDDDALAGELPKGEPFPTGQHHPPAHTGCRCLLVPSAATSV